MTTLEEIRGKPIIHEIPGPLDMMYVADERVTPAGEFFRRGLCPYPGEYDVHVSTQYCGAVADSNSKLGHCTYHYLKSGG